MKNKLTLKLFASLAALTVLLLALPIVSAGANEPVVLTAIADAHVAAGDSADLNYGAYSLLTVRSRATKDKNYYESYLMFEVPASTASVASATLTLTYHTVPTNAVGRAFVVSATETDWTEGTGKVDGAAASATTDLTYNTRPAAVGNSVTTAALTALPVRGDTLSVDVTSIVNAYLTANAVAGQATKLSLSVVSASTANETELSFRARTNTNGGAPTLSIVAEGAAGGDATSSTTATTTTTTTATSTTTTTTTTTTATSTTTTTTATESTTSTTVPSQGGSDTPSENLKTLTVATIADGQVRSGSYAQLNYGRASNMQVRYRTDLGDNYYESYMKFSVPAYVTKVEKAELLLCYQSVPANLVGRSYTVYTTATTWTEGSGNVNGVENDETEQPNKLTFTEAPLKTPANNSLTFTISGNTPAQYDTLTVDVTTLVNRYIAANSGAERELEISFNIASNATANELAVAFCTKEHTVGVAPKLALQYESTGAEPKPEEIFTDIAYMQTLIYNSNGKAVDAYVLEIDLSGTVGIVTGVPGDTTPLRPGYRQTPSEQAAAAEANGKTVYAAINADFFKINEDTAIQPRGLCVKDGVQLTPPHEEDWKYFAILKDGSAVIGDTAYYNANKENIMHAVGGDSGYLVKNGVAITVNADGGCHTEDDVAPRTAIGLKADGTVVMVVMDGRSDTSNGMVLVDLANYMLELGCVNAINLDGGGSSAMSIKDAESGAFAAVNNPSDGSERQVGNTLLVVADAVNAPTDTTTLQELVDSAEKTAEEAVYGDTAGAYPSEQEAPLAAAIEAAKAVLADTDASQDAIDAAVTALESALAAFEASKIPAAPNTGDSLPVAIVAVLCGSALLMLAGRKKARA